MKSTMIRIIGLILSLNGFGLNVVHAATCSSQHADMVKTEAGEIDFSFACYIKNPRMIEQKIRAIRVDDKVVDLENGSRWDVYKVDAIKGWERNKIIITQNQTKIFAKTYTYALLNQELRLAVPANLVIEPTPKDSIFVTAVDRINDTVTLNDGKKWIVHSSDRGSLHKISENDRIMIGVNTDDDKDRSSYILIDTSTRNHFFVRAQVIE